MTRTEDKDSRRLTDNKTPPKTPEGDPRKAPEANPKEQSGGLLSGISLSTYKYSYEEPPISMLHENAPYYGMQEDDTIHTLEDYYALPDEKRVELIDGRFFEMTAPRAIHQAVQMKLAYRFENYRRTKKGGKDCQVFPAPFDVQLDRDQYTMLEPDISIICDRDKIQGFGCYGAPDMIVEILSISTRSKDMYTKLSKYKNAGVREYWMVDPLKKKVIVYHFENGDEIALYGFDAKIPVGISGGELVIDFAEIYDEIRYLYD